MDQALHILQLTGVGFLHLLIVVLCLVSVALSCVSLSGTWVVTLATVLATLRPGSAFPGWWMVLAFLVVSALVEGVEALAGTWGVKKRGGSGWAGAAALVGGLGGMVFGVGLPVPVLGPLIGMMAGGFLLTFLVEHYRLKKASHAAHIAWGSVVARVLVIVVKVVVTLAMIAVLLGGMFFAGFHHG